MSLTLGTPTAKALRPNHVLTFLLIWYGWLSKEQGTLALANGLITIEASKPYLALGGTARLTQKGYRKLPFKFETSEELEVGYVYATYLREYGKLSVEPHYTYQYPALGLRLHAFDRYHSLEIARTHGQ